MLPILIGSGFWQSAWKDFENKLNVARPVAQIGASVCLLGEQLLLGGIDIRDGQILIPRQVPPALALISRPRQALNDRSWADVAVKQVQNTITARLSIDTVLSIATDQHRAWQAQITQGRNEELATETWAYLNNSREVTSVLDWIKVLSLENAFDDIGNRMRRNGHAVETRSLRRMLGSPQFVPAADSVRQGSSAAISNVLCQQKTSVPHSLVLLAALLDATGLGKAFYVTGYHERQREHLQKLVDTHLWPAAHELINITQLAMADAAQTMH